MSRTVSGRGFSSARSETDTLPPDFNTRYISRQTFGLSGERLITQLESTTSTLLSGTGRHSISPRRNSTLSRPVRWRYCPIFFRALASISGVMSTPITLPDAFTFSPAWNTSKPPPLPRSTTVCPSRNAAMATGLPQESPIFAPSGSLARDSASYPTAAAKRAGSAWLPRWLEQQQERWPVAMAAYPARTVSFTSSLLFVLSAVSIVVISVSYVCFWQ